MIEMTVTPRQKTWLQRAGTAAAVGVGMVGAAYYGGRYAVSKLLQPKQLVLDDGTARELWVANAMPALIDLRTRRRFQQNQQDSTLTVLELLPTLMENARNALPVERLTEELQVQRTTSGSAARTKAEIWHHIKIDALTRLVSLLYTVPLLSLLTRIQLNLLGRSGYLASLELPVESATIEETFQVNRAYLGSSWWFLHQGWQSWMARVRLAVTEVFDEKKPTEILAFAAFVDLIRATMQNLNEKPVDWLSLLLPPAGSADQSKLDENGNRSLHYLLDETSDLIESPMFCHVLHQAVNVALSTLLARLSKSEVFDLTSQNARLANILAFATKEAYNLGSGRANDYVTAFEQMEDVDALSALIFSRRPD